MTTMYCDGGCNGNGTAKAHAYGSFALEREDRTEMHRLEFADAATNNEAEYRALIAALSYAKVAGIQPSVKMDSALVVNQVAGRWKVNVFSLRPLCDEAKALVQETGAVLEWVPRDQIVAILGH